MDRRNKGQDPLWYRIENLLLGLLWWLSRMGLGTLVVVFFIVAVAVIRFELSD